LGALHSVLFLFLLFMLPRTVITRGILFWKKKLAIGWWRNVRNREGRFYAGQFALRAGFWILSAVALQAAIVPVQFDRSECAVLLGLVWVPAALLAVLEAFPSATLRVTTFVTFGLGVLFLVFQLLLFVTTPGDLVEIGPPVSGEWYVFHGGRGSMFNHHYPHREQSHALDLVRVQDGRTFRGDPEKLESYFAWDQDVIAPASGLIVRAEIGSSDEKIGDSDSSVPEGNSIVIRSEGHFILLAHLKQGSVSVKVGDSVTAGQVVAKCGNSGNTSEPHLHIQVQSHANLWDAANRTFPIRFKGVGYLRRNDRSDFGN
ncbi:MAG TPA: M23 family metallopeptidase, partial [Planctomycetota bacterium]|nr:M23 family metallopeptidase [Planctomycetota bacterium]